MKKHKPLTGALRAYQGMSHFQTLLGLKYLPVISSSLYDLLRYDYLDENSTVLDRRVLLSLYCSLNYDSIR